MKLLGLSRRVVGTYSASLGQYSGPGECGTLVDSPDPSFRGLPLPRGSPCLGRCVLLDVRASIVADARIGYGHCERMQWIGGRWMLAPGTPPAKAPSVWPDPTTPSEQGGARTLTDG